MSDCIVTLNTRRSLADFNRYIRVSWRRVTDHDSSMKDLLPVLLTYPNKQSTQGSSSSTEPTNPICPSCSRELTNATTCVLLTSQTPSSSAPADVPPPTDGDEQQQPVNKKKKKEKKASTVATCGHVVCGTCADTIVKPGKQCVVCEAVVRPDKDIIQLGKEGK